MLISSHVSFSFQKLCGNSSLKMSNRGMPSPGFYWHRVPPVRFKNGIVLVKNGRKAPAERDSVQYRLRFLPYLKDSVSEKGEKSSGEFL